MTDKIKTTHVGGLPRSQKVTGFLFARERGAEIPDDRILVPGVLDATANFVEHPQLVAQRLERSADMAAGARLAP